MTSRVLFSSLLLAASLCGQVKFTQKPDQIAITINDRPFSTFYYGTDLPKPYLHPLRTATGTVVTRGFPMEKIEGEPTDHPHHRGLWFGHGTVNGFNFWENEFSYKTSNRGKIVMKKIDAKGGAKSGSITADFDWQDPSGKAIMTEHRVMTFYAAPADERIVDFNFTFTPLVPITFGDTKEGTFAIRLNAALDEKHSGKMVNAEGKKGEKEVWGVKSNWVDYAGEIGGEKVGIAILDNPTNPSHPTRWHSRGYGLFAANPFGQKEFEKGAPETHVTAQPGQPMSLRYRVIIHPGDAQSANIAQEWSKYAGEKQ